jgi:hypothetical protein
MFIGTTWQYSADPPYKLPRQRKVFVESPNAIRGHPLEVYKLSHRYLERVMERQAAATSELANRFGVNDVGYYTADGLLADLTCQNIAYVVPHPERAGEVKIIFPTGSRGNYFFQGKTEQTVYELIQQCGAERGISAVRVERPKKFAREAGNFYWTGWHSRPQKELTQLTIRENVARGGMLAMGTYRGAEWVDGFVTEDGKELIEFAWNKETKKAAEWIMNIFRDATWALHGGVPLKNDSCLAADPMYCTLFEVDKVREGIVQPLKFRTVEDCKK